MSDGEQSPPPHGAQLVDIRLQRGQTQVFDGLNLSLTQKRIGVIGNMQAYTQYQAATAMEAAAENPSGMASGGIGMGMGFAMANQMGQAMAPQAPQPAPAPRAAPPPLPPQASSYLAAIGGQQAGPFDSAALAEKARSGELTRETLVWKQGMAGWTPAGKVPELASAFAQVPPPLPPA